MIAGLVARYARLGEALLVSRDAAAPSASAGRGGLLFQSSCAARHGGSAKGADVLFEPTLPLLDTTYLRRPIVAFRSGCRGGEGSSSRAKGMQELALVFSMGR